MHTVCLIACRERARGHSRSGCQGGCHSAWEGEGSGCWSGGQCSRYVKRQCSSVWICNCLGVSKGSAGLGAGVVGSAASSRYVKRKSFWAVQQVVRQKEELLDSAASRGTIFGEQEHWNRNCS